jgi:molybdenum cofactor biosynthesis protein B
LFVAMARVATITVSDSRTLADDTSGARLGTELSAAGFTVMPHAIVPDDKDAVRAAIEHAITEGAAAVILTGGTGIAPRDITYEVVESLLEKHLDGFGEAFRRLSWDEIGPRAILSRATAGVVRGALVFALPGSTKAVDLGMSKVILPILPHALDLLSGKTGHHK